MAPLMLLRTAAFQNCFQGSRAAQLPAGLSGKPGAAAICGCRDHQPATGRSERGSGERSADCAQSAASGIDRTLGFLAEQTMEPLARRGMLRRQMLNADGAGVIAPPPERDRAR